jgi:hypothetical protein
MRLKSCCALSWVAVLLAGSPLLSGCNRKVGDACSGSEVFCQGNKRALTCVQGKLADVACFGPGGCIDVAHTCDQSRAEAGNACEGEWAACTANGKGFLECKNNKLTETASCSGPQGCFSIGRELRCDQTKANLGDICSGSRTSCAMDGKALLACDGSKFGPDVPCRGPTGCRKVADHVECDQTFGLQGDKCEGDGGACQEDGKALLQCKANKLEMVGLCRGKEGCKVSGTTVRCDQSIGEPSDPCDPDSVACSPDGTALLGCSKGKLALSQKCKCQVDGMRAHCG